MRRLSSYVGEASLSSSGLFCLRVTRRRDSLPIWGRLTHKVNSASDGVSNAMATMISAADEYSQLKKIDGEPVEYMSGNGYVTFCDPCAMPRKVQHKARDDLLTPERMTAVKFPADEKGYPLEMEIHNPQMPKSAVPYLRNRFQQSSVDELLKEHDGHVERLDDQGAREHLQHGWTKDNDKKFRENEEMLRNLFGSNWDSRYGRTRVRSGATGQILVWGDGNAIYDSADGRPPALAAGTQPAPDPTGGGGNLLESMGLPKDFFGPADEAPAPAADDETARALEAAPSAVLRRGDTEVFEFTAKPIEYVAPTSTAKVAAFPHFPPSKMHVAGSMRAVVTEPPPEDPPPRTAYLDAPEQQPRRTIPSIPMAPGAGANIPADFGV